MADGISIAEADIRQSMQRQLSKTESGTYLPPALLADPASMQHLDKDISVT
jgi:hypothetical protein